MTADPNDTHAIYERQATDYDKRRSKALFEARWLARFTASLKPGDRVLDRAKEAAVVDAKWVRLTDAPVYNFTVAGNHNYYVSSELVLVHNNDCTKKFKKPKKGSGKEKATDAPSWVKNHPEGKPYEGESGTDFAKRMMDAQYGEGNWTRKGDMAKQYSQIKKFGDRGFE